MYLLQKGPKDLVELTTWAQQYLIAHKQSSGNTKKSNSNHSASDDEPIYSAVCREQSNDGQIYTE